MSDHTKEPWRIFTPDDYVSGELPTLGIDGANGEAVVWHSYAADGGIQDDDDARRIVACVNACAGIPTETLEKAATSVPVKSSLNGYLDMKQHRDELLAAAKAVHEDLVIRAQLANDDSLNISQSILDNLLSAIEKAK